MKDPWKDPVPLTARTLAASLWTGPFQHGGTSSTPFSASRGHCGTPG
jgi:hypothetical protein